MSKSDVTFICVIVLLMFLFKGEPDVFDKLRERAMTEATCK
jgi:hypothetical protein